MRKVHNEGIHNFYPSRTVIREIQPSRTEAKLCTKNAKENFNLNLKM